MYTYGMQQATIKSISTKEVKDFFTKQQLEMIEDSLEKALSLPETIRIVSNHNYDLLEASDPKRKLIDNYRESYKALQKISRMVDQLGGVTD